MSQTLRPAKPATDPAHDVYRAERQPLDAIFKPRAVAVIGASEEPNSVGRTVLWNLISNPFGGAVFPVNPRRPYVLGVKAYPSIAEVPDRVDLAVVATPAPTVPGVIAECVDAGVRGAIIMSAGFKERGPEGAELERQVLEGARRGRMRIVGPNCLGVMSPVTGVNATFAGAMARPGSVGFISQSGALCTAVLDWSLREQVGFSAFVSIGSMLDVGWGDLIDYLGDDPRTQSIILYMESIGDAPRFLSAAREVALTKPIIVIKGGRTAAAAQAAASHTGSLTGSDEVLDAAFARVGVLRVNNIADVFYLSETLGKQPRPAGPRLMMVTNAGGPGVLATDALLAGGGELAQPAPETLAALDGILPAHWSHGNPIDILGDAGPERYAKSLEIAAKDPNTDGLLVILTPQAMTEPGRTAEGLARYAKLGSKPVLASLMGGGEVAPGEATLNRAGIPTFPYPDTAARIFGYMWRYSYNLRSLYETPTLPSGSEDGASGAARAEEILRSARAAGRTILTEVESKRLLEAYGIPTVETHVAASEDEAVALAERIGYPAVLKLYSETITHKTDVGGVQLDLPDAGAVREAYRAIERSVRERARAEDFAGVTVQPMIALDGYELIVGSSIDPQFGPVLLFGTGGQLVEVYRDRALGLPPLNSTLARRMMERTRIYTALRGVRGRQPVDLAALEGLMVRFSQLVVEQPLIKELDINPLLASPERLIALDARVVLHDPAVAEADLPGPAICPYPTQYVAPWTLRDGTPVVIRPIRPEDEPLLVRFHQTLSERSVYYRYFHMMALHQRTSHERLTRMCFIDYDREMALVVERRAPDGTEGEREILAVGRLSRVLDADDAEAEFATLVNDQYQRQGLGTELLRRLLRIGRDEGLRRITAEILPENSGMQRVAEKLGFRLRHDFEEEVV
ncbi:MAG: bifunctional acetate--CoA ligase family protein/GNAT family N-acetyltransferase, partial [Chloroflexota bacterium]|nr:bifunctional acetate--CoA ligase family protein/GNAT family N-acetyltransferase [Chloroflexota bacterium]